MKIELEFAMLAFEPRKGSTRRKVSRSREREKANYNTSTQPISGLEARTRTQAILVGSECSHSALPSLLIFNLKDVSFVAMDVFWEIRTHHGSSKVNKPPPVP